MKSRSFKSNFELLLRGLKERIAAFWIRINKPNISIFSKISRCFKFAFSLVEILIALIIVSVVMAALAPVITKKIKSSGVTIGGGGGGGPASAGVCDEGQYLDENETCKHCPEGYYCDGKSKLECKIGTSTAKDGTDTQPLIGQSECIECAQGYYTDTIASPVCIKSTAKGCATYENTGNSCKTCSDSSHTVVDGNCVGEVPDYQLLNSSGSDITTTSTKLDYTKGDPYWYITIKASGTFTFLSLPSNVIDVFMVGGGAGGQTYVWDNCSEGASGGGSYNILKNVVVQTDIPYAVTIGAGGSASCPRPNGGTTSIFGTYTYGGVNTGSHAVCPFNDATCSMKYGQVGSSSNQIANSGNGGKASSKGMSGVVIIRGKVGAANASAATIPSYKYLNNSGTDTTHADVTLTVTDQYWIMKFAKTGTVAFDYLPNSQIDVFTVGGGAGGQTYVWDSCNAGASGGGNYNISKNVVISTDVSYPITIGSGASAGCARKTGNTTSAFGVYTHGGISTSSHSICPFGDATCDYKYGLLGTDINQNHNTGNGGVASKAGMSGAVLIRGKRAVNASSSDLPVYKFLSSSGVDATAGYSTLSVTDEYWYLKFASTGYASFDYLPTNYVDVFAVGGGAGGQTYVWDNCSEGASGGGTYTVVKDAHIYSGMTYPIVIGSGGSATCPRPDGGASSGFGITSRGGLKTNSYAICQFGDAACDFKHGALGTDGNQNHNTGNGGMTAKPGMSGSVMIRGKIKNPVKVSSDKIPTYTLTDSGGSNITYSGSTLNVTDTHWYIKFTKSGTLKFDSIKNSTIDVFAVGGGAGGTKYVWDTCSSSASGGGNYTVQNGIAITAGTSYTVTIGGGGGVSCSRPAGGTSSFKTSNTTVSASGGSGTTAHTVCLFNGSDCSVTYGNKGSDGNQFQNTGNGGTSERSGMSGTVVIRGTL